MNYFVFSTWENLLFFSQTFSRNKTGFTIIFLFLLFCFCFQLVHYVYDAQYILRWIMWIICDLLSKQSNITEMWYATHNLPKSKIVPNQKSQIKYVHKISTIFSKYILFSCFWCRKWSRMQITQWNWFDEKAVVGKSMKVDTRMMILAEF